MTTVSAVAPTPPSEWVLTPGSTSMPEGMPDVTDRKVPVGLKVFNTYGMALLDLPGVMRVKFRSSNPDSVHVQFENNHLRELSDGILRDTVKGAKFVLHNRETYPKADGADGVLPWYQNPHNMVRAAAGFKGVSWQVRNPKRTVLYTETKRQRDFYKDLINPKFGNDAIGHMKVDIAWKHWKSPEGPRSPYKPGP